MSLFVLPFQVPFQNSAPIGLAKLYFYRAGTTTFQPVYTTAALSVAHDQPVRSDAAGVFPPIYRNPNATYDYRIQLKDQNDALVANGDVDNIPKNDFPTRAELTLIGMVSTGIRYDITAAETAASVTPTNYYIPSHTAAGIIYDARYGATEGANNLAALDKCNLVAAQLSGSTIGLMVNSLLAAPWVVTAANTKINGFGHYIQFSTAAAKAGAGPDWAPYYQLLVVNANNVETFGIRFKGNLVGATSNYFGGCSFSWYGQNLVGGSIHHCSFENLRYIGGDNNVAIQVRNGSYNIHVHDCDFLNCAGGVSHQGLYGSITKTTHQHTDAASATPLTDTANTSDQPIGIDGSTGNSVLNNKCYRSSGAPSTGAIIGANSGTTDFIIANNEIYGQLGGVAYYIRNSSYGEVCNNLWDGGGFTALASWAPLKVDVDSNNINVHDNIFRNPLTTVAGASCCSISTGFNTFSFNKIYFGTSTNLTCLEEITKATTAGTYTADGNYFFAASAGTKLNLNDNQDASKVEQPMFHRNNIYDGTIATPYTGSGLSRNLKFYIKNDQIVSTAYNGASVTLQKKLNAGFNSGGAGLFPFNIGNYSEWTTPSTPAAGTYDGCTFEQGDLTRRPTPASGASRGEQCTSGGTFPLSSPYSQAGSSHNGTHVIDGLANVTGLEVGDHVSVSAGFSATGVWTITGIPSATSITIDGTGTSTTACTVTHIAPIFKSIGNLA